MFIRTTLLLTALIACLPACGANAAEKNLQNKNKRGFTFAPIAHANSAELLAFITEYTTLTPEAQSHVHAENKHALDKDQTNIPLNIKHAAMLALPNSTVRDTEAAQQRLQTLLKNQSLSNSDMDLVNLLHTFTVEHRALSTEFESKTKKLEALKKRNKILGQKLNDLKNIEKTMIKRKINKK